MSSGGHRIAVVGLGIVSALGRDPNRVFSRLCGGESGVRGLTLFDGSGQRSTQVAQLEVGVAGLCAEGGAESERSRCDLMGLAAARDALAPLIEAGARLRIGVAVGATTGGMFEAETVLGALREGEASRASAARLLGYPLSTTAARIAEELGGDVRVATLSSACSSGALAIALGGMWLDEGAIDCALVGGVDGLCQLTLSGFNALGATTTDACRPFDTKRSGLTLGEGAAFLALVREGTAERWGSRVLAWLSGWAAGAEAFHITHPSPSGSIPARLMGHALEMAGLGPDELDYVNAHGTGTVANDGMEAVAIRAVLADEAHRVAVSSSKPQVGHALGAAGAIEAVITVASIVHQRVPPTLGLREPDPACPLHHVAGSAEAREVRAALSNSFGFGGASCVLAFRTPEFPGDRPCATVEPELAVTGAVAIAGGGVSSDESLLELVAGTGGQALVGFEPLSRLDAERSRRFDRVSAMTTLGVAVLLERAGITPDRVGLASGSAYGNVSRTVDFLGRVQARGARLASPAEFPHLLPSAPTGNASIYCGLTGPVVTLADLDSSSAAAWAFAASCVRAGQAKAMVAGGAEVSDPFVAELLAPVHGTAAGTRGEGGAWVMLERLDAVRATGRRTLAVLREYGQSFGGRIRPRELPKPRAQGRCAVFTSAAGSARALEVAGDGGWAMAERFILPATLGHHEALGAIALACAVGAVGAGRVDEALVMVMGRQQSFWFCLARPEECGH